MGYEDELSTETDREGTANKYVYLQKGKWRLADIHAGAIPTSGTQFEGHVTSRLLAKR